MDRLKHGIVVALAVAVAASAGIAQGRRPGPGSRFAADGWPRAAGDGANSRGSTLVQISTIDRLGGARVARLGPTRTPMPNLAPPPTPAPSADPVVRDAEGNVLTTLEDWERLHRARHWRPGRSAHSIADFIVNRNGAARLRERVASALGEPVALHTITPEYEVRFDGYGQGRVHDLGIRGTTASGKTLFIGVEAKVDEPFGDSVGDEWREAAEREARGVRTNMRRRIRELAARFEDRPAITEESDIRYQLLYSAAGTVDAGADISVLYVAVFKTGAYRADIGEDNRQDWLRFIQAAGGALIQEDESGATSHRLRVGGKELIAVHECFDWR